MTNIEKYRYFTAVPIWKDNRISCREKGERGSFPGHFVGDDSICYKKFGTIRAALAVMKDDCTCLREMNWEIKGHLLFSSHHIPLSELSSLGYLSKETTKDSIGIIYKFL